MNSFKAYWFLFVLVLALAIACNIEHPEDQTTYLPLPSPPEPEASINDGVFYMVGKQGEKDLRMRVVIDSFRLNATYYYVGLPQEYLIKGVLNDSGKKPLQLLDNHTYIADIAWTTDPDGKAILYVKSTGQDKQDTIYLQRTTDTISYHKK